ncbi:DUF4435 domain-containing protein [Candidatus Poribacteria bacterium]|nr:DUF4435 domain-containing protein [Candidatus Poribacteria bacterium]
MSLSRTPSGLAAEHLFYQEILVYVEGPTDIPSYNEVLQNYNCRIISKKGKAECEKFAALLEQGNYPYVVVLDGDYEILEHTRSPHRRIVWLHRHSCENYLLEEKPIEKFRHYRAPLEDSLERLPSSFKEIVEDTELNFKELLVLDVAHQRAKTGYQVFPKGADQFFAGPKTTDFQDSRIQERRSEATLYIDEQSIEEARTLVRGFLKNHRFIDLLPGHFAFSIIRRWINHTVNVSRRILEEDIRVFLSTEVWRSVKTRDHNSLKRRLRRAVREAEQIRQSSGNPVQSNAGS